MPEPQNVGRATSSNLTLFLYSCLFLWNESLTNKNDMKIIMKCIFTALGYLVISLPLSAGTLSGSCGDNATWTLENHTLRISGTGKTTDFGNPNSIYASFPEWYDYRDDIKHVIVEEGITSLGSFSFFEYPALEKASLPEGLTRLGNLTFSGCVNLDEVNLPSTLQTIGDPLINYSSNGFTFFNCQKLHHITLPENLKNISGGSFNDCNMLTDIEWNAKNCNADVMDPVNRYVGIFAGSPVSKVTFGNKVTHIPAMAFKDVSSLSYVHTPGSITFVGYQAFHNTLWESTIKNPDQISYIDKAAYCFDEFTPNIDLLDIEIREGTTSVTDHLFENVGRLRKVSIPESVEYIGNNTFKGCKSLSSVIWNPVRIRTDIRDYSADKLFSSSARQVSLKEISFGDNVTSIPDYLLSNCTEITTLNLPQSLTSIGDNAFEYCSGITELVLPDNVETIGRLFTYECTNLETLTVGESLRRFNYYGFLLGNPKLKTLIWNAIRTEEKTFDAYHATDACMAPIEQFITGDKVEYIPGQLFWKNKTLTEVKLGKSVEEIGEAAFRECKFTSIKFPQSLKKIGENAFYRTPLEFIIIPESVTELGVWCLSGTPAKTIISCPTDAPSERSSFIDSDAETHFYVPDINSYLSNWNQYGSKIKPMAIADKYEFTSDDANPAPVFTSNIPGYKIAYYETPEIDTANGAHSIKVRMDFTGTYGDFSADIIYDYTFHSNSSIGSIEIDDETPIDVYSVDGLHVIKHGTKNDISKLPSGLFIVRTSGSTYKIRI